MAQLDGCAVYCPVAIWPLVRNSSFGVCAFIAFPIFRRPNEKFLLEFVDTENKFVDTPRGRSIVPGHAIESMWFMLRIYDSENDQKRIAQAVETIKWHLDLGWDEEWGGLLLAVDASGGTPWWANATLKLWWPHCEALYALLLAYDFTGEDWCTQWFERIDRYSFQHYPVPGHGEWRQKLDRYGKEFTGTVALPVKDPFHLPRALIYCIPLLESLEKQGLARVIKESPGQPTHYELS